MISFRSMTYYDLCVNDIKSVSLVRTSPLASVQTTYLAFPFGYSIGILTFITFKTELLNLSSNPVSLQVFISMDDTNIHLAAQAKTRASFLIPPFFFVVQVIRTHWFYFLNIFRYTKSFRYPSLSQTTISFGLRLLQQPLKLVFLIPWWSSYRKVAMLPVCLGKF